MFEIRSAEGQFEVWVDGVYFDTFGSEVDALAEVVRVNLMLEDPIVGDFVRALVSMPVER